jgi:polyisoprenoid-binding protein YceI
MARLRKTHAAFILAALLSACASQLAGPPEVAPHPPENFPKEFYLQAIARHQPVFRIDPARSLVVIEARRGGSLARIGHDHVVASHDVRGYVAPEGGRSDLYVDLARLVVDEQPLRDDAGFDTHPSQEDIDGTRKNMLKVLRAERYPFALVGVTRAAKASDSKMNVSITLHGMNRAYPIPLQIDTTADEIKVTGHLVLNQTDFGIVPLSILGGAIQVQDEVRMRFDIRARRVER